MLLCTSPPPTLSLLAFFIIRSVFHFDDIVTGITAKKKVRKYGLKDFAGVLSIRPASVT
jgi:hypothetical protein